MPLNNENIIDHEKLIFDKTYTCPCCDFVFKDVALKTGKVYIVSRDTDLFNICKPINPILYDVALCSNCGYAAIGKYFGKKLSKHSVEDVKKQITSNFKKRNYPRIHTHEIAIERLKLALLSAIAKGAHDSEKAYICIKIAWLYRDIDDTNNEAVFIEKAYNSFKSAFEKETPPIYGMDYHTLLYLIAELARRTNRYDDAIRFFGMLITSTNTPSRIKDAARDQKNLIPRE